MKIPCSRIENNPLARKMLMFNFGSMQCCYIVKTFSGDILALFQVLLFDRIYLHTLNNVCCHVYVYYSSFKFNFLFSLVIVRSESCSFPSHRLLHYFYWLSLTNTWTFSFDISSKFGLRFTIATIFGGSISLNMSKAISFLTLLCQFCVFKGSLINASKQ